MERFPNTTKIQKMNRSTSLHHEMVPPLRSSKATMLTFHYPMLEKNKMNGIDDLQISTLELTLNCESRPWSGEVTARANKERIVKNESGPT